MSYDDFYLKSAPNEDSTHWSYNARSLVSTVSYEDKPVVSHQYDAGGRLTVESYGNGLKRTISFNRADNLRGSDRLSEGTQGISDLSMTLQLCAR